MRRESVKMMGLDLFALALALEAAKPSRAADAKDPYPNMASLDQYLIVDPDTEIALARTAAPPSWYLQDRGRTDRLLRSVKCKVADLVEES